MIRVQTILLGLSLAGAAASAFAASDGRRVYESSCIACHGPDGQGAMPGVPDFAASRDRLANGDAMVLQRIRDGFQSPGSQMPMPPRGGNPSLTDEDLEAALDYMRKAFAR